MGSFREGDLICSTFKKSTRTGEYIKEVDSYDEVLLVLFNDTYMSEYDEFTDSRPRSGLYCLTTKGEIVLIRKSLFDNLFKVGHIDINSLDLYNKFKDNVDYIGNDKTKCVYCQKIFSKKSKRIFLHNEDNSKCLCFDCM